MDYNKMIEGIKKTNPYFDVLRTCVEKGPIHTFIIAQALMAIVVELRAIRHAIEENARIQ